jgi:glutathione peroxidase
VNNRSLILFILVMGIVSYLTEKLTARHADSSPEALYSIKMKSLGGKDIDFSQFKGHKLLIVNTASKCGYTPQYADLQKLHEQYGSKVVILGFPANNFLWQEPGSAVEIATFCEKNYGVTFQMFDKISVKGKHQHELYKWLEVMTGKSPSWNFCKYLVNENGTEVRFFPTKVSPLDEEIIHFIAS